MAQLTLHRRNPSHTRMGGTPSASHYVPEDDNGNLTLLDHRLGVNSVVRFEYGYDRNGMRTSMTDLDGLHEYGYDTLYQIVRATHPTVTNPLEQFQYDAAGNRLADVYRTYSYNELNQLVEDDSATYAYDLDGNMVLKVDKATGDSTKYEWDVENRLVRVVKPGVVGEYVYDALGRRVAKTVNGVRTEFRYDGEDLILTMDDAGAVTGSWTFGPGIDQPLAMNRGGATHYYLADGLGSIRALADSTGNLDQTYEYSVFGEITKEEGSVENPFTYTAREWEPEVGLYYYRARWYDARVGRFMSEDPLRRQSPTSCPYTYVRNAPTTMFDPSGAVECEYQQRDCYLGVAMSRASCVAKAQGATLQGELQTVVACGILCGAGVIMLKFPLKLCMNVCVAVGSGIQAAYISYAISKCYEAETQQKRNCDQAYQKCKESEKKRECEGAQ